MKKTKELAIALFNHMEERGNKFFLCFEEQDVFALEAEPIVAVTNPQVLRKNFDILIEYLADKVPAIELSSLRGRANVAVASRKEAYIEANKPVKYNQESLKVLKDLFSRIGWEDELKAALKEECAKAYLHGLVDSAYDEWGDASDYKDILCSERNCSPCDIELIDLQRRWPSVIFHDDEDWGFRVARGRLFCLRDYQTAKEAIASLGRDKFAQQYENAFGKGVPANSHLFDD